MNFRIFLPNRFTAIFAALTLTASRSLAQAETAMIEEASDQWWYSMFLIFVCGVGLAIYLWKKSKGASLPSETENRYSNYHAKRVDDDVFDADRELEWLRKIKQPNAAIPRLKFELKKDERIKDYRSSAQDESSGTDTRVFQDKMRKMQYAQLPINSFTQLAPAKGYQLLPVSDAPELLNAIEQANEEFEEDEAVRELALRVLAAFKTQNSVDAVAQIALYDLSANLRSKAVSILADFDHESVFEIILLACADPTREVRATAARGLFRLSFDRTHAWKRIIESDDEYRITQASRAAIEAGLVERTFERLAHDDVKVAYEAFALCSMLIKAGETTELFDALKNHNDLRVKFALLHLISVQRDERLLPELYKFIGLRTLSPEIKQRANEAIAAYENVSVWAG